MLWRSGFTVPGRLVVRAGRFPAGRWRLGGCAEPLSSEHSDQLRARPRNHTVRHGRGCLDGGRRERGASRCGREAGGDVDLEPGRDDLLPGNPRLLAERRRRRSRGCRLGVEQGIRHGERGAGRRLRRRRPGPCRPVDPPLRGARRARVLLCLTVRRLVSRRRPRELDVRRR